jgi:hypothetical protein
VGSSECLLLCFLLAEKANEMNPQHVAVVKMPDVKNRVGVAEKCDRFSPPRS